MVGNQENTLSEAAPAPEPENINPQPPVEPEPAMVSKEVYEQTQNDMHKFKRLNQENARKLQELEAKLEQQETERLEQGEDYKGLYTQTQQKLKEERERFSSFSSAVVQDKKLSKVREFAIKAGMRQEALNDLEMLSLDDVVFETTDGGRFLIHGADTFVEGLKASRPHWFASGEAPPINNSIPGYTPPPPSQVLSSRDLLKLEKEDPAAYKREMEKKIQARGA